ncbi:MAG: type II toxin-antitoxin system RelE/ParE family toxin [Gammaproteobacteria bacterium]
MPKKNIRFSPEALAEAEAAQQWYVERSLPAGKAFLEELTHAVERVSESPEQWPRYIGGTHRYVFHRFPFSLVYRQMGNEIVIVAVAHGKRKPGYWKAR